MAWKNDHYFATGSADHVIYIHHGDQTQSTPLRGADPDLTHLEWSPDGEAASLLPLLDRESCAAQSSSNVWALTRDVTALWHNTWIIQ